MPEPYRRDRDRSRERDRSRDREPARSRDRDRDRGRDRQRPGARPRAQNAVRGRPAGGPRPRGRRAGPTLKPGRAARIAVCLTSALVMLTSGVGWCAYHWLDRGVNTSSALDALRDGAPPKRGDAVNLLLIGLDSRKDMNGNDLPKEFVQDELHAGSSGIGGYNTNTLILMHIPAGGGKVTAFSIPRDDYVEIAGGRGEHKIKEAYGIAKAEAEEKLSAEGVKGAELEHRGREAGREATLATVQSFLGVPIDHFAEVNLLGFYDIAKVVQPVPVCLKHPVRDRYSGADFPAGPQQLDARQALSFVRQRHGLPGGDLDRTHRQQAFLSSVTHKLQEQGVWSDFGKLQGLFDVIKKDVVIDNRWNILDFARQAPNLTGGNAEFHTLPIEGFATRKGEAVNLVDPAKVKSLVQAMTGRKEKQSGTPAAGPQRQEQGKTPGSGDGGGDAKPGGSDPVSSGSFQGPPVRMGGVPCVD